MNRTVTLLLVLSIMLLLLVPGGPAQGEAGRKDGERLRQLIPQTIKNVESLPGLTAQPTARLIARTGITNEQLPSLRRYNAYVSDNRRPHRVTFFDLRYRGRKYRLGVAATPDGGILGPVLFDDFGKPIPLLDRFLSQFRGQSTVWLSEGSKEAIGDAIQLRDEVLGVKEAPKRKDRHQNWTLLRHHLQMWKLVEGYTALVEAAEEGEPLRALFRDLGDELEQLRVFSTHLKCLLKPKEVGQYRQFVKDMQQKTTDGLKLLDEGEDERVLGLIRSDLKMSCATCHDWKEDRWEETLFKDMQQRLKKAGFQSGQFVVDIDVQKKGLDTETAQMIAGTVKAGLLLSFGVDK